MILRVDYPWRPSWCPTCVISGHNIHNCPLPSVAQKTKSQEIVQEAAMTEKDDFIQVQKKGKGRMRNHWDNLNHEHRIEGVSVGNNYKHNKAGFSYAHRGGRMGGYSGKNNYRGEASGVNKVSDSGGGKNTGVSNKYSILATSNLIDNLEKASTVVGVNPVARDLTKLDMSKTASISSNKGRSYTERSIGQKNISSVDFVSKFMGSPLLTKKDDSGVKENGEFKRCELNSQVDVDSDLDDTSMFMVGEDSMTDIQGLRTEFAEEKDQEAFVIEQLFGGNRKTGNDKGTSNHGFNE